MKILKKRIKLNCNISEVVCINMDKEVLEAILGSYLKILGEVSEIKRLVEARMINTKEEGKVIKQQATELREAKSVDNMLDAELKPQKTDTEQFKAKENKDEDFSIIRNEQLTKTQRRKKSAENRKPETALFGTNATGSRNKSQNPFEPEKGLFFDKFISQKERADVEYDTIKMSQHYSTQKTHRISKMTKMSGVHDLNEAKKAPTCNFFNILEKEIEETL